MSRLSRLHRTLTRLPGFPGLLASNFALGMAYSFVVPFLSMWGTLRVGMPPLVFGLFMTITTVAAIVLSLGLARWSDTHVSRRTTLIIGSIGGMIGYSAYAFLQDVVLLTLVGCFALGTAAVNFSQIFAHIREELERPEHADAEGPLLMSLLRAAFSLAWIAGPALGALTMERFGYEGVFLGAAALFGVFLLGVLLFVPHRPHAPAAQRPKPPSLLHALTNRTVLLHFTGFSLVFAALNISSMNLPLLVTQVLGGTTGQVGVIFGVAPVVELPLMIWFGHLAARGHQLTLIRVGVAAAVIYFTLLPLVGAPWHIYPLQAMIAVAIAVTTNTAILFFQDLLPGQTGVATSIYSNAWNAGGLVGFFAFGVLVRPLGHRDLYFVCAALCAVTLVIVLLARGSRRASAAPA